MVASFLSFAYDETGFPVARFLSFPQWTYSPFSVVNSGPSISQVHQFNQSDSGQFICTRNGREAKRETVNKV